MMSPLWKRTPLRSLNSHWVSESAFQDVASEGSNSSLGFRWIRESNMLILTRMPTRSKCMWGSSVGEWAGRATVSVSLTCELAGVAVVATTISVSTAVSRGHLFMRDSSSVTDPGSDEFEGCGGLGACRAYTIGPGPAQCGRDVVIRDNNRGETDGEDAGRHGEHGARRDADVRGGHADRDATRILRGRRSPRGAGRDGRPRESHGHGAGRHSRPGRRRGAGV